MRATLFVGIFACVATAGTAINGSSVSAQTKDIILTNTKTFQVLPLSTGLQASIELNTNETPPVPQADTKPQPVVHEVKPNESLSTIASQHKSDWYRIFNKNEQLSHPDVIAAGDKITVPLADEQLKDRPLPEPPVVEVAPVATPDRAEDNTPRRQQAASQPAQARASAPRGSTSGNTYTAGYCTWYVKNMRPDLPNNLGNADTWVARAAAQGLPTGSTPRAGAVGQQGMHVVYVQSVNGDGTVTISEMNFKGLYVNSTRTVPASNFQYIY